MTCFVMNSLIDETLHGGMYICWWTMIWSVYVEVIWWLYDVVIKWWIFMRL